MLETGKPIIFNVCTVLKADNSNNRLFGITLLVPTGSLLPLIVTFTS
jgi:hypothetical protein